MHELLHSCLGGIRLEPYLLTNPFRTFTRHGSLGQLVTKVNFELSPIQTRFTAVLWDKELSPLFTHAVCHFSWHKGWRSEDELKPINL